MKQNLNQEQNKYQEALNSIKEKTTEVDEYEVIPKSTFCHCAEEVEVLQNLIDKYRHLEKALDKACEELHSNSAWCHYDKEFKKCGLSKEEWKEWLMNNAI